MTAAQTPNVPVAEPAGADPDGFALDGLVAVVTGATQGIGAAITAELGRAGARLVVASRSADATAETAQHLQQQGVRATGITVDVLDPDAVESLIAQTVTELGRVDILVNNAGGSYSDRFRRGPLLELSGDDLLEAYRLNVVSAFLCACNVVPVMRETGGGSIVNVASVAAVQTERGMGAYGASKAALCQLTKAMAHEWAPAIRVNAVAPGHIDTPRVSAKRSPERVQRLLSEIALGRMGTGDDVARAVRYLVSPAAAWMTGSVVQLDGGQKLG